MNGDDITAFIAAKQGTYYVPAGDIGDYRFLYRGYWYDRHLHIYHVRHRAYDPEIQRWLQPDPAYFVDGLNRYAYCGNEPVHMYDPMGLSVIGEIWNGFWHEVGNLLGGNGATQPAMGSNQSLGSQMSAGIAERAAIANEMSREQPGVGETARQVARDLQEFQSRGMQEASSQAYGIIPEYLTGGMSGSVAGAKGVSAGIAAIDEGGGLIAGFIALFRGEGDETAEVLAHGFTKDNFRENLGISLGRELGADERAHHIVAHSAQLAEKAREILDKFGIDVHDAAANGVALAKDAHAHMHTNDYYRAVNRALEKATSREEALQILRDIAGNLECGKPISGAGS